MQIRFSHTDLEALPSESGPETIIPITNKRVADSESEESLIEMPLRKKARHTLDDSDCSIGNQSESSNQT